MCLLAVTAMTVFWNMFTCWHDGVETLNFFPRWLEQDICRWLRCSGYGEICTRDHNLGGIDRVKKAKRISHMVIILTVRWYSFRDDVALHKRITCWCVQLLQTMQRFLPGLVKIRRAIRTSDNMRDIKDSLQSRIPHGTA